MVQVTFYAGLEQYFFSKYLDWIDGFGFNVYNSFLNKNIEMSKMFWWVSAENDKGWAVNFFILMYSSFIVVSVKC